MSSSSSSGSDSESSDDERKSSSPPKKKESPVRKPSVHEEVKRKDSVPAAKPKEDAYNSHTRKMDEKEKRKAEVRARLEEQSKSKKGFLTPERKKRLKAYIMKKAREEMLVELKKKEEEKKKYLEQRVKPLPANLDALGDDEVKRICEELIAKIKELEISRYDWESTLRKNDEQINSMTNEVNNLRGRYVKPTLKKVSKYDSRFSKMQRITKPETLDWRNNLKKVETNRFAIGDEVEAKAKPEWAAGATAQAAE